ncbi:MAG: SWIM zinc finger family protein [Chloroflexota bacterium]|nr:SWIM zinc finger family protein [Chloroflexota bacterium]
MAANDLAALLDITAVVALAGPRSFERGVGYQAQGRVGAITVTDEAIEATVQGTDPYSVRIAAQDGRIFSSCSCPMGDAGAFCKHCVALALAWIEPAAGRIWGAMLATPTAPSQPAPPTDDGADDSSEDVPDDLVEAYLGDLDRESLVELIVAEMAHDEALDGRIRLRATAASESGARGLGAALDRATEMHGYLDYGEVPAFARDVEAVADTIESIIGDGHGAAAIDLAERGLRRIESAIELGDDSDGYLGDLLRRFEGIHLAACEAADPDPVELAQRLFRWELHGDWDVFHRAAERYADVLGDAGLAEYRRLTEAEWTKVPERGPGNDRYRDEAADSHNEFNVTSMMESLARASGDLDALVAVMARDLSSAYQYLEIAELLRDAGDDEDALDWAERGVEAFPKRTDIRLREFLADAYLKRSRDDDAMALIWAAFEERPDLEAYQRWRRYAERTDTWPDWRLRALEVVRGRMVEHGLDGTLLVSIYTWESDIDAAWEAARDHGCERSTLLRLAKQSEAARPDDALAVFQVEIEKVLRVTDRRAYTEAIGLLRRIERLMDKLGRSDDFRVYAAEVRGANHRRPAFCSMFDAARFV